MKHILAEKKIEKNVEQAGKVILEAYGEVLEFLPQAIGNTHELDEPLLCAALEAFADGIKAQMSEELLEVYKNLKEVKVTTTMVTAKLETK